MEGSEGKGNRNAEEIRVNVATLEGLLTSSWFPGFTQGKFPVKLEYQSAPRTGRGVIRRALEK